MNKDWLKKRLRMQGKTSADLATAIQRDRAVVSRILNGHQQPTLDQAKTLASELGVELSDFLVQANMVDAPLAPAFNSGFAESDAAAWIPASSAIGESIETNKIAAAFGARAGVDIWRVKSSAMALAGMMQGDFMLIDTHQAERCRAGDVVIAQVYNPSGATTVLRRYAPPILMAHSADPTDWRVHVVDGVNVVVMGKVVASWRVSP